jgi:hypothetical protein
LALGEAKFTFPFLKSLFSMKFTRNKMQGTHLKVEKRGWSWKHFSNPALSWREWSSRQPLLEM